MADPVVAPVVDTPAVVPAATDTPAVVPAATDTPVVDPAVPVVDPAKPAAPVVPVVDPADPNKVDESDPVSPEFYSDFTLPEGVTLDEAALGKAAPIFKELGLNQEQAQKLVDLQAEMVQEGARSQTETFDQLIDGWKKDAENDKEFGGDKFEESISTASLAVEKFGTPEFKQLMEDHGVGNHPEMIRFMVKVGSLLREDVPGGTVGASTQKKDRVSVLYPNESKS